MTMIRPDRDDAQVVGLINSAITLGFRRERSNEVHRVQMQRVWDPSQEELNAVMGGSASSPQVITESLGLGPWGCIGMTRVCSADTGGPSGVEGEFLGLESCRVACHALRSLGKSGHVLRRSCNSPCHDEVWQGVRSG